MKYLSHVTTKPISKIKAADLLHLLLSPVAVQLSCCQTLSENPEDRFSHVNGEVKLL